MTKTLSDWKVDPPLLREKIRQGEYCNSTSGLCPGYTQTNLAILPLKEAFDFLLFCQRNPKPCPILEVSEPGDPILKVIASGSDLRSDLPAYRLYSEGHLIDEPNDIQHLWRDDLVGFLLGCSYTFDAILYRTGIKLPHVLENREPGIYTTTLETCPAGIFKGPLVVSARAIPGGRVSDVVMTTSQFEKTHGAPVHIGSPETIGISDLSKAEFGGSGLELEPGDVPVFWACGVTPQAVAISSKVPFMITHKPGHMFVSDLTIEETISS